MQNNQNYSQRIAICGMTAATSCVLMFLTGILPFSTFILPIIAGMGSKIIDLEWGKKSALLTYIATSLIALLVSPDREAAIIFITFFGYYPIIKQPLENFKPKLIGLIAKLGIFNAAILSTYYISAKLFGMDELLNSTEFGQYTIQIVIFAANFMFISYDISASKIIYAYINLFRDKFFRK